MNLANQIPHFGYKGLYSSLRTKKFKFYLDEFDMTNLAQLRKDLKPMAAEFGIKLSYMPFIIKVRLSFETKVRKNTQFQAVSLALNDYPILNARMSEDETELIYHDDHNIGVAVDTPHGLLVPNIKVC